MAKLEIFQNGAFADGTPAHQIGTSNADGGHDAVVFEPMTLADAKNNLKTLGTTKSATVKATGVSGTAKVKSTVAPKPKGKVKAKPKAKKTARKK